tara:strand:- start:192 stop:422 length:231 start_codon:yes stop_codon:yes gene_type:complete
MLYRVLNGHLFYWRVVQGSEERSGLKQLWPPFCVFVEVANAAITQIGAWWVSYKQIPTIAQHLDCVTDNVKLAVVI